MKFIRKVRVSNALGLHTRPATAIVKILQNCRSEVTFSHKREVINAKSILSILMLAARRNSQITITAVGIDAEDILEKLVLAFDSKFGE